MDGKRCARSVVCWQPLGMASTPLPHRLREPTPQETLGEWPCNGYHQRLDIGRCIMVGTTDGFVEAIGNTPLIRLRHLSAATGCHILGKVEFMNPGGSVKDRAALGIVQQAEASGALAPGGTVVEGTAGNTGIGLAHICNAKGYRALIMIAVSTPGSPRAPSTAAAPPSPKGLATAGSPPIRPAPPWTRPSALTTRQP